jgi:hypothetical protein
MPDLTDRDLILKLATVAYALDRDGPTRLARPLTAAIRRAVAREVSRRDEGRPVPDAALREPGEDRP